MSDAPRGFMDYVLQIEQLEEQQRAGAEQIKAVRAEAKGSGIDPKALGQILRERRMAREERQEFVHLCDLYRGAEREAEGDA